MAKIRVSILNTDTLRLDEDAKKGDIIDLKELISVDQTFIQKIIDEDKEKYIEKRLNQKDQENSNTIKQLNEKFNAQLEANKNTLKLQYEDEKNKAIKTLEDTITSLNAKLKNIDDLNESKTKEAVLLAEKAKDEKINKLEQDLIDLKNTYLKFKDDAKKDSDIEILKLNSVHKSEIDKIDKEKSALSSELEDLKRNNQILIENTILKEKEALKAEYDKKIEALTEDKNLIESKLNALTLQKSSLNVKKLGEELERWCNNEMEEALQYGFNNAVWYKDNLSIKNEDESKGTKADYIFKSYSSEEFSDDTLLTSVCLEMKNEAIDSSNKKSNSDHYKKLDSDRNKKNCEYAILVSELEWDSSNDVPIRKVNGYDKMYMVRPPYMVSLLSIIYAMSSKYKELTNQIKKEKLEFEDSQKIIDEFEKFKNTYLTGPLAQLEKDVTSLSKNNDAIIKSAEANKKILDESIQNHFETIKVKIERFDINKIARKINKLDK